MSNIFLVYLKAMGQKTHSSVELSLLIQILKLLFNESMINCSNFLETGHPADQAKVKLK